MAEAVPENNEIKQRAVRRLAVAVILVLVAVGILTYLSYYKPAKLVTKPVAETLPPPPPPIVTGPEPKPIEPAQGGTPLPELPPPPVTPAETPTTLGAPPPPSVTSKPLPPPGPGPKKMPAPAAQKPLVAAVAAPGAKPAPAAPPTPAVAPPKPAAAAPAGYVVQFGVFSNPQNAQQLVEKLKQAGIEAHTETRVQLPAFKTKAEAEAALAKMREKGITATIVAR